MDTKDNIARIDASRTYHLTFAAKHTFFGFGIQFVRLSAHDHQLQLAQAERCKPPCRTGSHAGSASDTGGKRRFMPQQLHGHIHRRSVHVYFAALVDAVSKIHC